ncbi:G protein-coupled receptor 148 [Platysternon megacephalum]|uniref:G protein-coupled receptor 148 n=1 Tax=Platysternon megacephalum TaxID=55544 RepID=A0A4D9DTZ9_9SAUR|nr:G protein-coupled receptor 148 [Platysternon megacephalum]
MMNLSNNSLNDPTKRKELEIIKSSLYLFDFIFITAVGLFIFKTVQQNSEMKKKVQYFLLCHHLLCCSLFSCFGVAYNTIRALAVESPKIVFWIIFGVRVAIGEGVLITLTLMALNRCFAVCWPFRYISLVHAVKHKVLISVWIITMFKSMCLLLIEGIDKSPEDMFEVVPSCSIVFNGLFARTTGIILILFLGAIIIVSYCLLCREGKHAGHFNSSNNKARKTIIIHGLHLSLLLFPPLIIIAVKRPSDYFILNLTTFVVFSLAQCFSPVVYGLRNKELQNKLFNRQRISLCTGHMINGRDVQQPQLNDSELIDTRCSTPDP